MRKAILLIGFAVALFAGAAFYLRGADSRAHNADVGLEARSVAGDSGRETEVSLRSLGSAGPIVTVIGEINYDASQLKMKNCRTDGEKAGKALHVNEPVPGTIRAVLAGSLNPLPASSDVMTCTFQVTGRGGKTVVRAHGEVADTTYVDRPFALEQAVQVGS